MEKHYFEMFRRDYALPDGKPNYGDNPDVIWEGERKIGIEMTCFYIEKGNLPESEQVQSGRREWVVSKAQKLFLANDGRRIVLSISFDKARPIQDQEQLAKKIAEQARSIEGPMTRVKSKEIFKEILEVSDVYWNSEEYENTKWRVTQLHSGSVMDRTKLEEIVRTKEAKVAHYQRCDAYWLLVVIDFINRAQDQEIPNDGFIKIDTNIFEKVIVYRTAFGHVLEAK